jgi:excinuclease ABC subunit A
MEYIRIRGARTHNLRDVSLDLPRQRLVVITGLSGSGKSSLAFDTLYAEGQRRYVESLSSYARQFLQVMEKPEVDLIEGLSPAIAIGQRGGAHNPRSTVGTVTEVHDYLRLLFARAGEARCPLHDRPLAAMSVAQMVDQLLALPEGTALMVLAPLPVDADVPVAAQVSELRAQGFVRVRVGDEVHEVDALPEGASGALAIVIDRLRVRDDQRQRMADSLETALRHSGGRVSVVEIEGGREHAFSAHHACPVCSWAIPDLEPRLFSFNSPAGACPRCAGLGSEWFFDPARVVAFPELSLASGAIRGWDRRNQFYFQMLSALGRHYGFDLDTPFSALPARVREAVLHGSGSEAIRFAWPGERGRRQVREEPFEGIVRNLERRYRETDSALVREELAQYRSERVCPDCDGARLRSEARCVRVGERTLHEIGRLPLADASAFFASLQLPGSRQTIAQPILREIASRLGFLVDVGLPYLSLDRAADPLSGGESQRIRLASQVGSGLAGVMYVLDEPSIGLHPRDNARLIGTLGRLRDLGNSVIVVEHDQEAIEAADWVVDMGPGAGVHGGSVVAQGTPEQIATHPDSLTGQYLSGRRSVPVPARRALPPATRWLRLAGARGNNLRGVDLDLPAGLFTCVTGVSGSGKSTLVNDTLVPALARRLGEGGREPAPHDALEGGQLFDKLVSIDQGPIGRTPRSNAATYTGVFGPIRDLFAGVPEARTRGYGPGRFSFNVRGGRCEACQGDGMIRVEMHFLADVYVPCDLCRGARYNRETLEVRYRGLSIAEVLDLTVEQAVQFFSAIPAVVRRLRTLAEVGLAYLRLGQSATTLSGGEAQRVKLALELSRRDTGRTLYVLDEPTTGLHFEDVAMLLRVLHRLCDRGNTVVVIEHNLDVVKTADWLVDLGPEGGSGGGRIVATGTPETIADAPESLTGRYLGPLLGRVPHPRS